MSENFRIENHTAAIIVLFPTHSFPSGVRLLPGLNTVPSLFMEEFREHAAIGESVAGKPGAKRYPGREVLEAFEQAVYYYTVNGRQFGPRITIYTDDQVGREDGPMAPADLSAYSVEAALALVKVSTDKAALKRWTKDKRPVVAQAVTARLVE